MDTLPPAVIGLVAVAAQATRVAVLYTARRPAARPELPYVQRPSLLCPDEKRFYRVLLKAAPPAGMTWPSSRPR